MIKYQVIGRTEVNGLVDELVSEQFIAKRLGTDGLWFGEPVAFLQLPEDVTAVSLTKLLQGDFGCFLEHPYKAAANQQTAGAFKLEIEAHPSLNALYAAAAPRRQGFVAGEHFYATWSAVELVIRNQELLQRKFDLAGNKAYPIAAVFHSAATANQQPSLKTTAVFPLYGIGRDGSSKPLDLTCLPLKKLQYFYESSLDLGLRRAIGGFPHKAMGDFQLVGVPQKVVDHFSFDATATRVQGRSIRSALPGLSEEELTHQWRREANSLGWGPAHVELYVKRVQVYTALADARRELSYKIQKFSRLPEMIKQTVSPLKSKILNLQKLMNKKDQGHSH